jgi:hypothetical protein
MGVSGRFLGDGSGVRGLPGLSTVLCLLLRLGPKALTKDLNPGCVFSTLGDEGRCEACLPRVTLFMAA